MSKQNKSTVTAEVTTATLSNATLLEQIMAETRLVPSQEGYQVARQGVAAFIAEILRSHDPDQLLLIGPPSIMLTILAMTPFFQFTSLVDALGTRSQIKESCMVGISPLAEIILAYF